MICSRSIRAVWLLAGLLPLGIGSNVQAFDAPPETPESLVRSLYDLVTFDAGTRPDWDLARPMFLEDAVVVLRTSREANTVFSVQGWIDDFDTFIDNSPAKDLGFSETVVRLHTIAMGDIANVWVLYESKLPDRPGRQGVDNFSLIRAEGKWKIASIVNELPIGDFRIPDVIAK